MNFAAFFIAVCCSLFTEGSQISEALPPVQNSQLESTPLPESAPVPVAPLIPMGPPPPLPVAPVANLASPAPVPLVDRLPGEVVDPMILTAAQRHNVRPALVKSIVAAESQFNPHAVSQKGAVGLMQLMPETAQQFGVDPMNPAQNIEGGTHYLRVLLDRYHRYRNCMARAVAAYNAGPGMVDKYRGVPPFRETRDYVVRVLNYFHLYQRDLG